MLLWFALAVLICFCCGGACLWAFDNFNRSGSPGANWTTDGSVVITTQRLKLGAFGTKSRAIWNADNPDNVAAQEVRAVVNWSSGAGTIAQLILGYVGASDYYALEALEGASGTLRLIYWDGTRTTLTTTTTNNTDNDEFSLCYDTNTGKLVGKNVTTGVCVSSTQTLSGKRAGVGSESGEVFFDNFSITKRDGTCGYCAQCGQLGTDCAQSCNTSTTPYQFQIDIPASELQNGSCTNCEIPNGQTFIVTQQSAAVPCIFNYTDDVGGFCGVFLLQLDLQDILLLKRPRIRMEFGALDWWTQYLPRVRNIKWDCNDVASVETTWDYDSDAGGSNCTNIGQSTLTLTPL